MTPSQPSVGIAAGLGVLAKARPFLRSPARFAAAFAGRRGSKTATAARKFANRIYLDLELHQEREKAAIAARAAGAEYNPIAIYEPGAFKAGTAEWHHRVPRLHYWVVAETYDLLDESKRWLSRVLPAALLQHTNTSDNSWWLWPDIFVEFKSGQDPKRLVSVGLSGVWFEEVTRLLPTVWQFVRPALSDKRGWAIITGTPLGHEWSYRTFVEPALAGRDGYSVTTWTTLDNTFLEGIAEEVEQARSEMSKAWFDREYCADFGAFIGQIYPEYDRATMLHDAVLPGTRFTRLLGGADWGFSNPGALEVAGITERCGCGKATGKPHIWFLDEMYSASKLVEQFWIPEAKKLQEATGVVEWVADPAEPDNLYRFQQAGIRMAKHSNLGSGKYDEHARSVLSGIRLLSGLMHEGRFHVLRKCKNLDAELTDYVWDKGPRMAEDEFYERPKPGQKEHAATVARYIATYALRGHVLRSAT